ncbi:hypothetical protein [Mesorhizobium sp.]|uniref:hypothetical protein n=1 Tax=Mesorhizobium sp. TaxID=1871066 RepID=UPI00257EE1EE|nr:hypothetical protein [Mesorhizobium sp.]
MSIKEGDRVVCIDFGTVQSIDEDDNAEVVWDVSGCAGDVDLDRLRPAGAVPSPQREAELLEANNRYQQEARDARAALKGGYQDRVHSFMLACFGEAIAADGMERNHRFLEESLELVQALGCTASEAHQLVDYVFGRPVGEPNQETGGTLVTLAALCNAHKIDMDIAGETELTRCWSKIDKIRAKQAAKPKHGPLPS